MVDELDDYLQDGSLFLPDVTLSVVNSIIKTVYLEPSYFVGHDVARGIFGSGGELAIRARTEYSSKRTATQQDLEDYIEDLMEYVEGYTRPLQLLLIASFTTGLTKRVEPVGWRVVFQFLS